MSPGIFIPRHDSRYSLSLPHNPTRGKKNYVGRSDIQYSTTHANVRKPESNRSLFWLGHYQVEFQSHTIEHNPIIP